MELGIVEKKEIATQTLMIVQDETTFKEEEAIKEEELIKFYQDKRVAAETKEDRKYNELIGRKWDKDCYTQTRARYFDGAKENQ